MYVYWWNVYIRSNSERHSSQRSDDTHTHKKRMRPTALKVFQQLNLVVLGCRFSLLQGHSRTTGNHSPGAAVITALMITTVLPYVHQILLYVMVRNNVFSLNILTCPEGKKMCSLIQLIQKFQTHFFVSFWLCSLSSCESLTISQQLFKYCKLIFSAHHKLQWQKQQYLIKCSIVTGSYSLSSSLPTQKLISLKKNSSDKWLSVTSGPDWICWPKVKVYHLQNGCLRTF